MLVLDMIYVDLIVKEEKSTGTLGRLSHALDPLGFGAWQMQSLDPMGSSLTLTLKVFLSPLGSRENASNKTSFTCGFLAPWAAASPIHNQGTFSPNG